MPADRRGFAVDGRLLFVVDSAFDSDVISQLQARGVVCRTITDYAQAIALIKRDDYIRYVVLCVCTDEETKKFVDAARILRADIKVVGSGPCDERFDFELLEVDQFLPEPWTVDQLMKRLATDANGIEETRLGNPTSDTSVLKFQVGNHIRVLHGTMRGVEGIVVGHRSAGRLLIQLGNGMFVEINQFAVEQVGR